MSNTEIILGCLFAVFLTLADIASSEISKRSGRRIGLMCWVAIVALPICVVLALATKVAVLGMVVSTVLSFIAYRKRMRDYNKDSEFLPAHCSDD